MKKKLFSRDKIILFVILLLASFLRFYQLADFPVGFHSDEASLGYNAYSLLKTGKDENNQFLPLYIDSFGDFRPAGYFYLLIPFVKFLGLSEFTVRFPSAIFGVLTVLAVYFLAKELFTNSKNPKPHTLNPVPLLTALLLAISPWHINLTRASSESSVAMFLVVLGFLFFILAVKKARTRLLVLALLSSVLSFFFYHSPRLFVPLLTFTVALILQNQLRGRKLRLVLFAVPLFSLLTALLLIVLPGGGGGRIGQVSIFSHPEVQLVLDEQIREEGVGANVFITRFFHNKVVNHFYKLSENYLAYFSGSFLFFQGGLPLWYRIPSSGLFYLWQLPFLILGISFLIFEKDVFVKIPLLWTLIGPLPAAPTFDDVPNVQRSFFTVIGLIMILSFGIFRTTQFLKQRFLKKLYFSVLVVVGFYSFLAYSHQYYHHQKVHRPWYRDVGAKELIAVITDLKSRYTQIFLTKAEFDPYIFYLFYNKIDSAYYQQFSSLRTTDSWGFENLNFMAKDCPSIEAWPGNLYVDFGNCRIRKGRRLLKEITRPDGTVVYRLVEACGQNEYCPGK